MRPSSAICLLILVAAAESGTGRLKNLKYQKCLRPAFNGRWAWIILDDCSNTGSGLLTIDISEIENSPTRTGTIRFMSNWQCLSLNGDSPDNGHPFLTWGCLGQENQNWKQIYQNQQAGTFILKLLHSGGCLSVESEGRSVNQWDCVETADNSHQTWTFEPFEEPNPYKLLESAYNWNRCLQHMPNDTFTPLVTKMTLESCNANSNTNLQQQVTSFNHRAAETQIKIAPGVGNKCLTTYGTWYYNRVLAAKDCDTTIQQQWRVVYDMQENYFKLATKLSTYEDGCLESTSDGIKLVYCSDSYSQLWKFKKFQHWERSEHLLESDKFVGQCLRPNPEPTKYLELEVVPCDVNQGGQQINARDWLTYEAAGSNIYVGFSGGCLQTKGRFSEGDAQLVRYQIQYCEDNGYQYCLPGFYNESRAQVIHGVCTGEANQRWKIISGKLGVSFRLQNEENGDCLTVKGTSGHTSLWVDDCSKLTSDQFWNVKTGFF